MKSTTEGQPDDSTESAVDQAKRDYELHVANIAECIALANNSGNADVAHGYLFASQTYATLAQATAARLQAEHLERLTTAVVSAVQAAAQFGTLLPPVVRAFQEIAGQLARQADAAEATGGMPPVVSAEDPDLRGLLGEHLRKVYPSTAAGAPPFVCRSRIRVDDGGPVVVMCRRPEPHAVNGRHTSGHDVFGRVWMWSGDDPRVVSPDDKAPAPKVPQSDGNAPGTTLSATESAEQASDAAGQGQGDTDVLRPSEGDLGGPMAGGHR